MASYPDILTILWDGNPVGWVTVSDRHPCKFFGQFTAGPGFEVCGWAFEEAGRWIRKVDEAQSSGPLDYQAWDRYIVAIQEITKHIELPELPAVIEEFAVDHNSEVEVTFERPID